MGKAITTLKEPLIRKAFDRCAIGVPINVDITQLKMNEKLKAVLAFKDDKRLQVDPISILDEECPEDIKIEFVND